MSLATLKKKAASKYRNSSTNTPQFSLNGVHRNQGYIGQTSMSRSSLRTTASGVASQGHGGCCGTYAVNKVKTSSICTTENASVVKSSVLSSQGMLAKRLACCKSIVKPDSNNTLNSQSVYLQHKKSDCSVLTPYKNVYTVTYQDDVFYINGAKNPPLKWRLPEAAGIYRFDQSHESNIDHRIVFTVDGVSEFTYGVTVYGEAGTQGAFTELTIDNLTQLNMRYMSTDFLSEKGNVLFASIIKQSHFDTNDVYTFDISGQLYVLGEDITFESSLNQFILGENIDYVTFDGDGHKWLLKVTDLPVPSSNSFISYRPIQRNHSNSINQFTIINMTIRVETNQYHSIFSDNFNSNNITINMDTINVEHETTSTASYSSSWGGVIFDSPSINPRTHYLNINKLHFSTSIEEFKYPLFGGYMGGFDSTFTMTNSQFHYTNSNRTGIIGQAWNQTTNSNPVGTITIDNCFLKAKEIGVSSTNPTGGFFAPRQWNDEYGEHGTTVFIRNSYVQTEIIIAQCGGFFGKTLDKTNDPDFDNGVRIDKEGIGVSFENCYVLVTSELQANAGTFIGNINDIDEGTVTFTNCYSVSANNPERLIGSNTDETDGLTVTVIENNVHKSDTSWNYQNASNTLVMSYYRVVSQSLPFELLWETVITVLDAIVTHCKPKCHYVKSQTDMGFAMSQGDYLERRKGRFASCPSMSPEFYRTTNSSGIINTCSG